MGYDLSAFRELDRYRSQITHQQYLTLKGQILAGNSIGAMKGLTRILNRKRNEKIAQRF